jgi:hypothetical protein
LRLLLGAGARTGLLLAWAGEQHGHSVASCTIPWGAIGQVLLLLLLLLLFSFR